MHKFKIRLFLIATALIVFSTVTIGILTSQYVIDKDSALEFSLMQSNIRLGAAIIERVEQKVINWDRTLYDLGRANDLEDLKTRLSSRDRGGKRLEKEIYLMSTSGAVFFPEARRDSVSSFFRRKVLPQIQVDKIALNRVVHLHALIDFKKYSLFSFLKFKFPENDTPYMLVMEYNLDNLDDFFLPFLSDLTKSCYACIRDYENNLVYGWAFRSPKKYFVELRFPTTFYRWLLLLSPRNVDEIEKEQRDRRFSNIVLVVINLVLILSAWFLVYISRREESKLTRLKEAFVRNVSHELKTPLALIKMFSELLVMGKSRDEQVQKEYLDIIFAETERMTLLINNILDFSNLERGVQKFNFEKIQLEDVVKKHLDVFDYRIKKDQVRLQLDVQHPLPPIRGDVNALALILLNLLDNAIKYSGDKEKQIWIRLVEKEGQVVFDVEDKGIGIAPGEISRIFEKFYRSDNIAVRKVRGSGIGLSLVKYIVQAHQGTIHVESAPGEGSLFSIRFPALKREAEPDSTAAEV